MVRFNASVIYDCRGKTFLDAELEYRKSMYV